MKKFIEQPEKLLQISLNFSNEEFVSTVFRTYLMRNPDSGALAHYAEKLDRGLLDRQGFIQEIQSSQEYEKKRFSLDDGETLSSSDSPALGFGVNLIGFIKGEFGLGESARANIRTLKAADIPLIVNQVNSDYHRDLDSSHEVNEFVNSNDYAINLINVNPEHLYKVLESFNYKYFENRYNIGFWSWEMPKFKNLDGQMAFDFLDEIWVPSSHTAEAISLTSPLPVFKVMHSIEMPMPSINRENLGLPKDKFIFLFMFDALSTFERKNPEGLVRAFIKAFGESNDDVLLVIKCSNLDRAPSQRDRFRELIASYPFMKLIEGFLMREEVNALLYNCDCYVSLHRAEGFGLTMAEAMYYGKPVIATAYSSNLEFMNVGNSFLVKYDLIEITESLGHYQKGDICAEPDLDRAAYLMRYVFENYKQASRIGARAAYDVKSLLSPKTIARKVSDRTKYIWTKLG